MNSRIDYKTSLHDLPTSTIKEIAKEKKHPDAFIELTLRAMNSSWLTHLFNPYEATMICMEQLKQNPTHNFYHLALGMLEEDRASQKRHLISAALYTEPCGNIISGQAAYQLGAFIYQPWDKDDQLSCQAFAESQVCFTLALLLGNKQAADEFKLHGRYKTDTELSSVNGYIPTQIAILVCLALKKFPIKQLPDDILKQTDEFKKIVYDALKYTTTESVKTLNSPIRKLIHVLFNKIPEFYFYYFNFCYQYGLIDKICYLDLLHLIEGYVPHDLHKAKTLANHSIACLERGQLDPAYYVSVPAHTLTQEQLKYALPIEYSATSTSNILPPNVTAFIPAPLDSHLYPLLATTQPPSYLASTNPLVLFSTQAQPPQPPTATPSPTPLLTPVYKTVK